MITSRIKVMMAHPMPILAACAIFASSLALVSCGDKENFTPNPNNPKEQTLPSAPFTVKVCVTEPGAAKDSVYVFGATVSGDCTDGKATFTSVAAVNPRTGQPSRTFSVTPDAVELALTPWNSITFEISPDVQVNASSSADVADIVAMDSKLTKYTLKPKKSGGTIDTGSGDAGTVQAITDGHTDIRFWNGTTGNENSITIRVRTANHIAVEGFEFALDGKRYALVETDEKQKAEYLPGDAYLCTLPCIARPMEEWYINGKYDYKTEEVYYTENFSTIEILGTIPRNATPDNKVRVYLDPVSSKSPCIQSDYEKSYIWSRDNYDEFRWLPYISESDGDSYRYPSYLESGGRSHKYYPTDLCYRKSKIFNYLLKESHDYIYSQNFHFRYSATPDGAEGQKRFWWGLILNLFSGQNPNAN